ncbi:hypothetical protein JAAARDRAFT_42241 [Jaapia argillacea MUCL 33604]|uniref:Uncharacterized protein n=1 Tax=Jaapia argillacea MUCL 33604 TaxID=933084 RepID=A0A067P5Q5_9AGAM|nr:hypothetical protein JAAARDRAFT_42241 [Jaapia argillacea MUCL 33604]
MFSKHKILTQSIPASFLSLQLQHWPNTPSPHQQINPNVHGHFAQIDLSGVTTDEKYHEPANAGKSKNDNQRDMER